MSNPNETPTIAPENLGRETTDKTFVPLNVVEEKPKTNNSDTSEDFRARCKSFEPVASSLWSLPIGVCSKVLRVRATKVFGDEDDDEVAAIVETAKPSAESVKAAKEATARVLARRCSNGESADAAILTGVGLEIAYGFYQVLQELKRLEQKKNQSKNESKKSNS